MSPAPPKPVDASARPRARRWLDALTGALLLGSAGAVLFAAAPALLAAFAVGGRPPRVPRLDAGAGDPAGSAGVAPEPPHHGFVFAPEDDDRAPLDDLERLYPEGLAPHRGDDSHSVGRIDRQTPRSVARTSLTLLDQPGGTGTMGTVPAGSPVMVVKAAGAWVLVAHQGASTIEMGWVPATGLTAAP